MGRLKKIISITGAAHRSTADLVRYLAACKGKMLELNPHDLWTARVLVKGEMEWKRQESQKTEDGPCRDVRKKFETLQMQWKRCADNPERKLQISADVFEEFALSAPLILKRIPADLREWAYQTAMEYLDSVTVIG